MGCHFFFAIIGSDVVYWNWSQGTNFSEVWINETCTKIQNFSSEEMLTHICVSQLAIIGSDNGFSSGRRQTITWINTDFLSIGPLETNFGVVGIEIQNFSFMKMHSKMSCAKWRPFCVGLKMLIQMFFNKMTPFCSGLYVLIKCVPRRLNGLWCGYDLLYASTRHNP